MLKTYIKFFWAWLCQTVVLVLLWGKFLSLITASQFVRFFAKLAHYPTAVLLWTETKLHQFADFLQSKY